MKNSKLKNILLFVFAAMFSCCLFLGTNQNSVKFANAASPVGYFANLKVAQKNEFVVTELTSGKKVLCLYPNSNGIENIIDAFSYYKNENYEGNKCSQFELFHSVKSPAIANKNNGQFVSLITLSNSMKLALEAGYVSASASATFSSRDGGKIFFVTDKADKVTFDFYAYNNESGTGENLSISNTTFTPENHELAFDTNSLKGNNYNAFELSFKSDLQGSGVYNNMVVTVPTIVFETSDFTAPSIEVSSENGWTNKRTTNLSIADTESGVSKVEYKLPNGDWTELAVFDELTLSETIAFELEENGTVLFRATDNIGNVYETSYFEQNIDKVSPSLDIDIVRNETDMSFDFNANFDSNQSEFISPESYYYTYNINGGAESEKISLVRGTNHFEGNEVGEYNFTFFAEDEAGNSMTPLTKTLIFKKQLQISSVEESYVYSGSVIDFIYSVTTFDGNIVAEQELLEAGFDVVISQNGEAKAIKDVGTYNYQFVCSNQFYVVSQSGTITVSPYEIILTVLNDKFEYSSYAIFLDFVIDKEVEIDVTYTDAFGNIVAEPKAVGNYFVTIKYVKDNNYILNETLPLTITKRNLTVSAIGQKITYGDPVGEFLYNLSGTLDGDNLSFDIVCDYLPSAGSYVITFKQKFGLTEQEALVLQNYELIFEESMLEIEKRTAYIIPNENQSKLYYTEDPTEFGYTVSGLIGSDTLSGAISRESGEDAGFYQFTLGTLKNPNYNLQLVPATFQITKRVAYIVLNSFSKVYGEADPIFSFKTDGTNLLPHDIEDIKNAIVREEGEDVGTYTISINKSDVKNYVLVMLDATLKITKRPVKVVADQITAEYGDEKELTYTCENLVAGDRFFGNLTREKGNALGEYKILQGDLNNSNYEIEFVSSTYKVIKKSIKIVASNSTKTYGEQDNLEFLVLGTDKLLNISLIREEGENVGTYNIIGYEFDNLNYVVEFEGAILQILPAKISIEISDATKVYGSKDPQISYAISGLVADDELSLKFAREVGENVGTYQIYLAENNLANYEIENIVLANLTIEKADLNLVLNDKVVTYSGNANYIDAIQTGFDIIYVYTLFGMEIEPANVVNAAEYKVYAKFLGNENYNESVSNVATLTVSKKLVPITLKKSAFNFNGEGHLPEFDIGLKENVSLLVSFANNVVNPTEVGEYDFTIVSNDSNYVCDFKGTLTIFEGFLSNTNGAHAITDSVGASSLGIRLFEDTTSALRSKFNALRDGRKCIGVYGFKTAENYSSNGEVFTVSIKAVDNDDVKIYAVDKDGKMVAVSYTIVGGCYVVSVNDISASILVTVSDSTMLYAKAITVSLILVLCYIITKTVRNQKRNYFYRRNTKVRFSDYNELKDNDNIVEQVSYEAEVISGDDFINQN